MRPTDSNSSTTDWVKFAKSVIAIAALCKLRWDMEMANEYVRPIKLKTSADRALGALRRIYDSEGRMPGPTEVIAESFRKAELQRWIIVERRIIGKQASYEFARPIPHGADPERHVRAGERLISSVDVPADDEAIDKMEVRREIKKALRFDPDRPCPTPANMGSFRGNWESIGDVFKRVLFVNEKRDELLGWKQPRIQSGTPKHESDPGN